MTETIQQLKEDIAILQMKLKTLEEAEKQPKTLYDAIRNVGYSMDDCYKIVDAVEDFYENVDDGELEPEENKWKSAALRFGEKLSDTGPDGYYEFSSDEWFEWALNECFAIKPEISQERVEFQPTRQTPEQVSEGLKDAMKQAKKDGVFDEPKQKTLKEVEKLLGSQTLYDLIGEFLNEIDYLYNTHSEREYFLEKFEQWLPKEQSAKGSQNSYVECTVEGWNDCLKTIKRKLR